MGIPDFPRFSRIGIGNEAATPAPRGAFVKMKRHVIKTSKRAVEYTKSDRVSKEKRSLTWDTNNIAISGVGGFSISTRNAFESADNARGRI